MVKLYFGNSVAIISTLLLGLNIGYMLWGYLSRTTIQKWGMIILLFILLHGALWYFANVRDLYSNSIIYATDGSVEMGLFSVSSIQSIVFWVASVVIWGLGIISIFKPEYRQNIFFIIVVMSIAQIAFIEGSRIWLYNSVPTRFDYM
ncbi:hypothetical protein KLL39_05220 [Clostridioides difficile]|nr:hypothetical protein [Clostridioides difficile]MDN9434824.1 hypothetical protein [Clostridioides difficile]